MMFKPVTQRPKTVEEWLDEVSYADLETYVPSQFAMHFVNFIKMVNGKEGEENVTPVLHYKMLDGLISDSVDVANMVFRGAAKTTLLGEYLILYLAVFGHLPGLGKVNFAIYVSDSMDNGVKNMRKNLEFRWLNSPFLQELLPKDKVKFTDAEWDFTNSSGKRFIVKGYGAKALSLDSELFTPTGRTTIGACKVGDQIYGADGKLTTITRKSEVFHKPMYKLELEDGRFIKVSEDHLNPVVLKENCNNKARYTDYVLTTTELLDLPLTFERKRKRAGKPDYVSSERTMFVRNIEPIQYPNADLPIDPYTLGVILGGGRIRKDCGSVELTCHAQELSHYHKEIPYAFGAIYRDPRSHAVTQSIRGLGRTLKAMELDVRGELKFIPHAYFYGSVAQRIALVQGLMDTDGTCSESGRTTFSSQSYQLCDDLACMVRSLGGTAFIRKESSADVWRVEIWSELPLFRLPRKAARFKPRSRLVAVKAITPIKLEPSQCIAVDNEDRQFITECYFRTHNTGVRGAKSMGKRPQIAILDDLVSDDDARSPTVLESIRATVHNAVNMALHPKKRKRIWLGTPFNANDPLYEAIESGAWRVSVYPICERFPCSREEFRGAWEDRFNYDFVSAEYDKAAKVGRVEAFYQELMLRIMSDDDRLIPDADIQWYSVNQLMRKRTNFNFYVTTDFATTEKQSADFSFISVWAVNHFGQRFWVDGVCERQTMDKNIDDVFRFVQLYKPMSVGIEVTGQQGGFVSWIQREMVNRNIFFTLASSNNGGVPGIRPVADKFARFNLTVPDFRLKRFFFPEEKRHSPALKELVTELKQTTVGGFKSKHDDGLDTISMLNSMEIWTPSYEDTMYYNDQTGLWEDEPDDPGSSLDSYLV